MARDVDDAVPADERLEAGPAYAPNSIPYTRVVIPPGVNPESLVCYSATEGQD